MSKRKKGIDEGIKRYVVLVFFGIIVCFWLLVTYDFQFRASIVYIIMGFGGLTGYILFKEYFRKLVK